MSDVGIPNPKNLPIRPLTVGMVSTEAPNAIPAGGFLRVQNYIVSQRGLKRRPGFLYYCGGNQIASADWPLLDVAPLWTTAGLNAGALITNRYLYSVSGFAVPAQKYWAYTTGTITLATATITGSGTLWATASNRIMVGDVVILDANGSGDGPEEAIIKTITDDTHIVLEAAPVGTYGAGTDYAIRRRFHFSDDTFFDYAVLDNALVITDHARTGLYSYNGTTLTEYASALTYKSGCVAFVADRLWLGNTIEGSSNFRQRIRWSSATNHTTFDAADYCDLPYTDGFLRRLVPLSRLLIAYFQDAVYIGRPSNLTELPYQFDRRIDTGGVGLIGTRAITTALNGHFFVGQDDVYFLDISETLTPLNCPVKDELLTRCANPEHIYLATDFANDRIVLGVPGLGQYIDRVWSFNYKKKAWSYDLVEAEFISSPHLDLKLTWDDLPTVLTGIDNYDTGLASYGSWDAISGASATDPLFRGSNGYLYILSKNSAVDEDASITGILETPDLDFGDPDGDKTISRITLRLAERASAELRFVVTSSSDGGNTWRAQGTLVVDANTLEGKVDFAATDSSIRFRLTESSGAESYEIIEMSVRVLMRGIEYEYE